MKMLRILFAVSLLSPLIAYSQKWQKVEQKYYNMVYELPGDWAVDGFGNDNDWEDDGSAVCSCAGTINNSKDEKVWMVAYPMKEKSDSVKRQKVWDYRFIAASPSGAVKTEKLTFTKTASKWSCTENGNCEQFIGSEVWRFTAGKKYRFVIYFWGKSEDLKANEQVILKILQSFRPQKS